MKRQRDCARCGAGVGRRGRDYCCNCWRKVTAAAAKAACPKCGKLSILQPGTGACVVCSRACVSCGLPVRRKDAVLCQACNQRERRRAAQRPCPRCGRPGYLREVSRHPHAVLERCGQAGPRPEDRALARVLGDFFAAGGLALPADQATALAAARRQRLVDAVPAPLRPAAARFCQHLLHSRDRARRAGTRPRAVFDVEAFLALRPAGRPGCLKALRHFFTWARASKLVLTDPTRGLTARQPRGYQGPTALLELQRRLFRRWTGEGVHPHEALAGLLTLIHGASNEELRGLTASDVDPAARTVRLGRRPHPVPLDPATWAAVERCLRYHRELRIANPHLLVTRKTKATRIPASEDYTRNLLRPAGVTPRLLRCTRLASMTTSTDPKLVSAAFGIHPQAATHYLSGHVDDARLPGTTPDGAGRH